MNMRIFVTAKPRARQARLEEIDSTHFIICVKEPPADGRANRAIIKALAEHLGLAPSRFTLVSGVSSKRKVFETS